MRGVFLGIGLFGLLAAAALDAHPGGRDKQGGHVCRKGCAKYGLVDGQYHIHEKGGGVRTELEAGEQLSAPVDRDQLKALRARLEVLRQAGEVKVEVPRLPVGDWVIEAALGKDLVRLAYSGGEYFWLSRGGVRLLEWAAMGRHYYLDPVTGDTLILGGGEGAFWLERRIEIEGKTRVSRGEARLRTLGL